MVKRGVVLMPCVPRYSKQVSASWDVLKELRENGYLTGLMIVVLGGIKGLSEHIPEQIAVLRSLKNSYGEAPIVVMLSNMPLGEIDFLHYPVLAMQHVKQGIEFAKGLPIGGRRIVSFHLNSLVSQEEFKRYSAKTWRQKFWTITNSISFLSDCARRSGVEIVVESVPVPEYGDLPVSDARTYHGAPVRLLFNPFYLSNSWGFAEVRGCGAGICLDFCHNRTIYQSAQNPIGPEVLFKEDLTVLSARTLFSDVLGLNPSSDIAHLNDGRGLFSFEEGIFEEGVSLGGGDIERLPEMIKTLFNRNIPVVLEVNEPTSDFIGRPEARKSIKYILQMA